jgi:two-component system response regulator AtoC
VLTEKEARKASMVGELQDSPAIGAERSTERRLLGVSPAMQDLFRLMLKASSCTEPVLILGETGTGKELIAEGIHNISARRENPFIPIDCCTVTSTLIESELFGHIRGAFTGAVYNKAGLFEAARGGTVLLDEIGEMPLDTQSKLLRALQEGYIRPVGSTKWIEFDARIIASTNVDLHEASERGAFRKDLYYRLNVITIEVPALRERKEDIIVLADYFLHHSSPDKSHPIELSAGALECLLAYDWPGNVRELENCIRRAVLLGSGPLRSVEDLPGHIRKPGARMNAGGENESLDQMERHAILRAIKEANGDKCLAARKLGIGKTTIYRKLKEIGLE